MAQSSGYDVAEDLKLNVVRIEAVSGEHTENGFGFIVGERGGSLYIATANHVVYPEEGGDTPAKVKVEFYDRQGEMFDATLRGTHDVTHDLAVLSVVPPQGFQWKKHCLGRTPEHQKLATEVWFIGKTRHWIVPVTPGRVASEEIIDGKIALDAMSILPGSSGGPLVASSGIVGLVERDSADNATALSITYVKAYFKEWNHPWDLDAAETQVVVHAPPVTPVQAVPTPAATAPAVNPLHEGWYELYTWNDKAIRPGALIMRLRRVSDDYFLAESATSTDHPWSGELRRSGNAWDLKIVGVEGARVASEGSPRNPGSGSNEISKEGPLLTFRSARATFVWKESEGTAVATAAATSADTPRVDTPSAQPTPAPSAAAQFFGAVVGGLIAGHSSTTDRCLSGYVWRGARQNDHVCVTEETRRRTAWENSTATERWDPYRRGTCLKGYVWREAVQDDRVCVTPESRMQADADNRRASSRVAR